MTGGSNTRRGRNHGALRWNPNRLVSLWDMLLNFKAGDIYGRITALIGIATVWLESPSQSVVGLDGRVREELIKGLDGLAKAALGSPFKPIDAAAQRMIQSLADPSLQTVVLADRIFALLARYKELCEEQASLFITQDKRTYFDSISAFGDKFSKVFPAAITDAEESCKCFALDRWTACVFHLMRVAEYGLRSLAMTLHVQLTHRGAHHPIECVDWDKVITGAQNKILNARGLAPGPRRQAKLELLSDAADHCAYMKGIWRNNASHARRPYKESDASVTFDRVRDFMRFLGNSVTRL